jgi:hypothetical protein
LANSLSGKLLDQGQNILLGQTRQLISAKEAITKENKKKMFFVRNTIGGVLFQIWA